MTAQPHSVPSEIALLREMVEELADAYVAFYGGDFDDEDETVPRERDMIARARALLDHEPEPARVLVVVEGGMVQDTFATEGVDVTVIDYDAEEATDEDVTELVPQDPIDGDEVEPETAYVRRGEQHPWSQLGDAVRAFLERDA